MIRLIRAVAITAASVAVTLAWATVCAYLLHKTGVRV